MHGSLAWLFGLHLWPGSLTWLLSRCSCLVCISDFLSKLFFARELAKWLHSCERPCVTIAVHCDRLVPCAQLHFHVPGAEVEERRLSVSCCIASLSPLCNSQLFSYGFTAQNRCTSSARPTKTRPGFSYWRAQTMIGCSSA